MIRRSRRPIVIWLLVLLGCAGVTATTPFSADMSAFLPRSPSAAQQILVDQVQNGVASRLILIGIENGPPETLAALSKGLAARLRRDPAFVLVSNGEETALGAAEASPDGQFLWRNRYLLSPGSTPARFTVEGLRSALEDDLHLLSSNLGSLVNRTLPADPTGEMLRLISALIGKAQLSRREGVWFSPDGRRSLLIVQMRASGFEIGGAEQTLAQMRDAFATEQAGVAGAASAQLVMTGPAVFAVHTKDQLKDDISWLSLIATVLISGILLATYRSLPILVLALLPVATGALAGLAAVRLGFGFVHGITVGFGVTLIGEGVDYAIYLLTQTAPGTSAHATLPRIWSILQLGVLVSVCGFSAMLFSSFTGFAQLGLFSIVGLLVALAVTRWVLPRLLPSGFATPHQAHFAPALMALVRRASSLRWLMLIGILAAAALLALHRDGFWEDNLATLSPIPVADQKLDQNLRRDVGAPDVRYLIVTAAADPEQALLKSEAASEILDRLGRDGALTGYDAPSQYLPSTAIQRARQEALPAPEILRTRLAAAALDLPFKSDIFGPFIADVAAARIQPLLDRQSLDGTSLALKLDGLLFRRHDQWVALISLHDVADPAKITEALAQAAIPGLTFVDLKVESDRLLEAYRTEAVTLALVGGVLIVLLLAVSLRSIRRVVTVVLPLGAAVVAATALVTIDDQKLSIFNLIGLLLTVAVGSNYSIFFERQDWNDPQAERMVASVVLANICTAIGFGILSFARFPVLRDIGMTVAIGAFLSLVFSAIVTGSNVPKASAAGFRRQADG